MEKPTTELRSVTCHPTQVNALRFNPSQTDWYSIYPPRRDERLSWWRRLVTYRDGLHARRQSPIQVLTLLDVEQLCWSDTTRYRYATPPTPAHLLTYLLTYLLTVNYSMKQKEVDWRRDKPAHWCVFSQKATHWWTRQSELTEPIWSMTRELETTTWVVQQRTPHSGRPSRCCRSQLKLDSDWLLSTTAAAAAHFR